MKTPHTHILYCGGFLGRGFEFPENCVAMLNRIRGQVGMNRPIAIVKVTPK